MRRALPDLIRRRWVDGLLALMLILGLGCTLNLGRAIGQPFGGFFVWRNAADNNAWQVEASTPSNWPALALGRLSYEDDLLTLEGQPYDPATAPGLYAAAYAHGRPVRITVRDSAGRLRDTSVPVELFQFQHFFDIKLPDLINGLGFWLLAVGVYNARRHNAVNRRFAILCGLVAGGLWISLEGVFPESDLVTRTLRLAWCLFIPFISPLLFHLGTLFPEPLSPRAQQLAPAAYLLSGIVALAYALSEMLWWLGGRAPWIYQLTALSLRIVMALFGIIVLLALVRLAWLAWKRRAQGRLRSQASLMLVGVLIALPYVLLVVLRTVFVGTQSYSWAQLDLRYLGLAFPLAFAFAILRYQTFRGAQPMLVGIVVLASSALLASVGAWLVSRLVPQWQTMGGGSLFGALFIIALSASLFWSTRRAWQGAFNRLFQWEQRSYAAVREVGHHVVEQIDLRRLPETIADALVDHLQLECAAVWLWDDREKMFRLAARSGHWPQPLPEQCCSDPLGLSRPVRLDAEDLPANLLPLRAARAVEVIAPLSASGQLIGLLGLGRRGDEEMLDERDLEIIELVGQQVALFLFTALQVEQLRQVPERMARQVAEAQERERFSIAQELHDTTQQFLGRLPFYLAMSRDAVRTDPAEAESLLERCLADVETAAQTLRQIRNNLAPTRLAQNLGQPLRALVEQTQQRTGLALQLEMEPAVEAGLAGQPEARHALYRVVQQAIDNAVAHAQATAITISLRADASQIHFSISDNGHGSSEAERSQAAERGSFGLKSMQARITSLGGEFALESAPGQGTTVRGWLPVVAASPAPLTTRAD
jgi:signal transduction histidine kinase